MRCTSISFLTFLHRASISALKEGEDQKRKTYTALCVMSQDVPFDEVKQTLEDMTDLELAQHTPIRVLHRRPDAKRMRTVYHMKVEPVLDRKMTNDDSKHLQLFYLKLATQAGTYVKEFVHGDLGRTEPNVAQMLKRDVDIIALDVEVLIFLCFIKLFKMSFKNISRKLTLTGLHVYRSEA